MRGGFDPPHLYSTRQREGRVPPAPVSGRGHPSHWFRGQRGGVHPLRACFRVQRGGWTPLSPFSTWHREGQTLLTIFDMTRGGRSPPRWYRGQREGGITLPAHFRGQRGGYDLPHHFRHDMDHPSRFFLSFSIHISYKVCN